MDAHENTNLNISLDNIFIEKSPNQCDGNDSVIRDLFMSHLIKKEPGLETDDTVKENGSSSVSGSQESESEESPRPVVNQVACMIEKIKNECNVWKKKYSELVQNYTEEKEKNHKSECQLAEYEEKLSETMTNMYELQKNYDTLLQDSEICQNDRSLIAVKLEEKEAELKQFKNLLRNHGATEEEMLILKKEISEKERSIKKTLKENQHLVKMLSKKSKAFVSERRDKKKALAKALEFGENLISNGFLTPKQVKNFENFIESFKIKSFDTEDVSEDSCLSQEEENTALDNSFSHSVKNNTYLPNGTFIKKEISSEEELANTSLSSQLSTSGLSPNIKSSENSKDDKLCVFRLPFSPSSKVKHSSYEAVQPDKTLQDSIANMSVDSSFPHNGAFPTALTSSDVEIVDDFINLGEIKGKMVMDMDLSPLPEEIPLRGDSLQKIPLYSDNMKNKKMNDGWTQASSKKANLIQKDNLAPNSNECKRKQLCHQTSNGFEPSIEDNSASINSTNQTDSNECKRKQLCHQTSNGFEPSIEDNSASINSTNQTALNIQGPLRTVIPPNLHYIGSSHLNDTYELIHQGVGVLDYVTDPDLKLTTCLLTVPKRTSNDVLLSRENRMEAVMSAYETAKEEVTSVKRRRLNFLKNEIANSVDNNTSYIFARIDEKNGLLNLTSFLDNNSVSDKQSNLSLTTKEQPSEVMQEENVPGCIEKENGNYQEVNQNNFNRKKAEDQLPIIVNYVGNYNEMEENSISACHENDKPNYSASEKSLDINIKRKFSAFSDDSNALRNPFVGEGNKVLENSNNGTVPEEPEISAFENSEIVGKIISSTPKHNISNDKNKYEREVLHLAATCNNNLQNSSPNVKRKLPLGDPFESPDKQIYESKSSDTPDNSRKYENKTTISNVEKHPHLISGITNLSPEKRINEPSKASQFFQGAGFKSPVKQAHESNSCGVSNSSRKSEKELENIIKQPYPSFETAVFNPDKEINEPSIKQKVFEGAVFKSNTDLTHEIEPHDICDKSIKLENECGKITLKHDDLGSETTILSPDEEEMDEPLVKQKFVQGAEFNSSAEHTLENEPCDSSDNSRKSVKKIENRAIEHSSPRSETSYLSPAEKISKPHVINEFCQDVDMKSPVDETCEKKYCDTSGTPEKHFKNSTIKHPYLTFENTILSPNKEISPVKLKIFQGADFKSPAKQILENELCDASDNSQKSENELKNTTKQPCLSSESAIFNPDKQMSEPRANHKFFQGDYLVSPIKKTLEKKSCSDSDSPKKVTEELKNATKHSNETVILNPGLHIGKQLAENAFSEDVESPSPKKIRLSEKSPFKMFAKDDSSETLKDPLPDLVKTSSSPKKMANFQSSVHFTDSLSVHKSYGVFKKNDTNFSNSCNQGKHALLNSVNLPKKIETRTEATNPKFLNVSPCKNANGSPDVANNLPNASQKKKRKKKSKNKRNKKCHCMQNSASSVKMSPKNLKKSCCCGTPQNNKSSPSVLQKSQEIQSPTKMQLQTNSENSSYGTLGQCEIKRDIKPAEHKKTDSADFMANIKRNSTAKFINGNSSVIPSLQNKITKNIEEVTPSNYHLPFSSQSNILNKGSKEDNEGSAVNADQEKVNVKKVDNSKINSGDNLFSADLINDKEQPNPLSSKEDCDKIYPHPSEHSLKDNTQLKDTTAEELDKLSFSSTFEKSAISTSKIEHSFENNTTKDFGNSQNEVAKIQVRRNSCQSSISEDESPLVIADDEHSNPMTEIEPNIENNKDEATVAAPENSSIEIEVSLSTENEKSPTKAKQKKRKRSKASNKNAKSKNSCEEEFSCDVTTTIESALDDIKKMKIEAILTNHSKYKMLLHTLINALINPAHAPNTTSALYRIFSFLSSTKLNPLVSFLVNKNISAFCPPSENCIVEALIKVQKKRKYHLEGLISSAITTLYYLVLDKKSVSKTGLGAFCRVFTQLCKHTGEQQKPIRLCCDLIKEKHPLAPVLIAFIMGTWMELFDASRNKEEYRQLLLSSIFFGIQKKPPTVTSSDWNACKALFEMTADPLHPFPTDIDATKDCLIYCLTHLTDKPLTENEDIWASDQLLILIVVKGWTWAEENVMKFVVDSLHQYAKEVNNEGAFSMFAELCAEIGKLAPDNCVSFLEVLTRLFLEDCDFDYVKKHSARCLLKLLLFKKWPLPEILSEYIAENASHLNQTNIELYLRRRCIGDEDTFTESDVIIT